MAATTATNVAEELAAARDAYVSDFEDAASRLAGAEPRALTSARRAAIERFAELGLPGQKNEDWKYTSAAPIARASFRQGGESPPSVSRDQVEPLLLGQGRTLVFVNGLFAPDLSDAGEASRGLEVRSLAEALAQDPDEHLESLSRYAGYEQQPFAALNTAFARDGAVVRLGPGQAVEAPIHLLFIYTAQADPIASHPRNLISLSPGAEATVVETHVSLGEIPTLANPAAEVNADQDAILHHYKVIQERPGAFHVGQQRIHQQRDSGVRSTVVAWGGSLMRNEIHAVLDDEGADCGLGGLSVLRDRQHVDHHLRVEHAKPNCTSREYFKGVLDERARGVFTGRIVVQPGAQQTDAKQSNPNLLLSNDAQANSRPQLEIFADDVKCTHAATNGHLDEDALFYLRSRGIGLEEAKGLVVRAFADEVLSQIRVEPLRRRLQRDVFASFPGAADVPEPVLEAE